MVAIFDLKNKEPSWANEVNALLEKWWPEYIQENGRVGEVYWWQNYEAGKIPNKTTKGVVKFIGEKIDEFDEEYDSIEIEAGDETIEYDRIGYWESPLISVGKAIEIESFKIRIEERYGPHIFHFEKSVKVNET